MLEFVNWLIIKELPSAVIIKELLRAVAVIAGGDGGETVADELILLVTLLVGHIGAEEEELFLLLAGDGSDS